MKFRQFLLPLAAAACAVLMMGVEKCNPDDSSAKIEEFLNAETAEPKAVVTVHEIVRYPRADEFEMTIPGYFGEEITIKRHPLHYSKEIMKITAVPQVNNPGFYNLKVKFSSRGRKMWIGLSVSNKNQPVAFVVDGMFYRSFKPRLIYDDESDEILIDGPFDQATALEIQNNSEKNYRILQRK